MKVPNSAPAATVAALCVSGRSIYRHLPGVAAYGSKEGAQSFDAESGLTVVAHPPCRYWSKYLRAQALAGARAKSLDVDGEKELGRWCVRTVLRCGGVLEQPAGSHLWADMKLPLPGQPPRDGVWTLYTEQSWFGYASRKPTWLLICGVAPDRLPAMLYRLRNDGMNETQRGLSHAGRSRTMPEFAEWLVAIARLAKPPA